MQTQFNPGGNGFAFGAAERDVTFGRLVTSDGKEYLPAQATHHTQNVQDSSPPGRTRFCRVRTPMAQ